MLSDDWHEFTYGRPVAATDAPATVSADSEGGEAIFAIELFVITNTNGWRRTTDDRGMAERLLAQEREMDPGARLFRYKRAEELHPFPMGEDDEG